MKRIIALLCGLILMSAFSFTGMAQSRSVSLTLKDKSTGEPVAYATVSLTKSGEKTPYKYVLTDDKGKALIDRVAAGSYTVKAELHGYKE